MRRILPWVLWTLVLACLGGAALMSWRQIREHRPPGDVGNFDDPPVTADPSGRVMVDLPWKHLPHISRFQLTDQSGQTFDTADLAGRPLAVCFFFARCPTICRDLTRQVAQLRDTMKDSELLFVSISVDPENDTPEVLARYAQDYDADPRDWVFLTGPLYKIREVGEQMFRVIVDPETHTGDILLVDRWGRFRDRFTWDDPSEMKRFVQVAKDVLAETEPPLDRTVYTRNAMAGVEPPNWNAVPWIREFFATRADGSKFYSRDLTGQVWIGSLFFSTCPGICIEQNQYLAGLQERLAEHPARIVSLTTDPVTDTPAVLSEYARKMGADPKRWELITAGDANLTHRISSEFYGASSGPNHHSSLLFVIDRWGNLRGRFDWQQPREEVAMLALIDQLNAETRPPAKFEIVDSNTIRPRLEDDSDDVEEGAGDD